MLTIIIATYNAGEYLDRCLESIVKQKTEKLELIIIDGGSNDNTNEIIASYGRYIDYTISEKDNGVYDAWNKGISKASHEWIQFIGADDILLPNSVSKYVEFINSNHCEDVDIITAKSEYVDRDGKLLQFRGNKMEWCKLKNYMCMSHGSTLHNKRLFKEIGSYNLQYKICADYELLLRKKDKLRGLFFNQPVIRMQAGGLSFSVKGQIETYRIKKIHRTCRPYMNNYHLIKGMVGFIVKKLIWKV